jgi:hypothetical protein
MRPRGESDENPIVKNPGYLSIRAGLLAALLAILPASVSCRSVDFYERERLGDSVMSLDENPAETHFHQKVFYSMEGSAGGIGTSAGGGCGCY